MWTSILFLYGTVFGSFFHLVGSRVPVKQSIVSPRSYCPTCQTTLSGVELVPVLSYVWQKGRCRHCCVRISLFYPLVELVTGALFAFSFVTFGLGVQGWIVLLLISLLVIVTVSDLHYLLIPNAILLFFLPFFLLLTLIRPDLSIVEAGLGATIGFLIPFLVGFFSKGGMGGGDIKLFALLGLALGVTELVLAFFLSTAYGAVLGWFFAHRKGNQKRTPIPFAPFIALGTLTSIFFGEQLIDWYMTWFL